MTGWDMAWELLRGLAAIIWGLSWMNVAGLTVFGYLIVQMVKWHRDPDSKFDLNDLFMENGKASQYKISINVLLALSCWAIITLIDKDKTGDAVTLAIATLGWFIGGRAVNSIWKPSDGAPPTPSAPPGP